MSDTAHSDDDSDVSIFVLDDIEQELLDLSMQRRRGLRRSNERRHRASPKTLEERMDASMKNLYLQDPEQLQSKVEADVDSDCIRPDQFLRDNLRGVNFQAFASKSWELYFTVVTPERIAAHCKQVGRAIRKNHMDQLYLLQEQGSDVILDSCNSHGESMMHLACRLGRIEAVKFMVAQAQNSQANSSSAPRSALRVRDDQGKTPLHDVCWSNKPNFDLVRFLVEASPELLFIEDYRHFSPLHYVPTSCWKQWNDWISSNATWLQELVKESTWLKVQTDLDVAGERMQRLLNKAAQYA